MFRSSVRRLIETLFMIETAPDMRLTLGATKIPKFPNNSDMNRFKGVVIDAA